MNKQELIDYCNDLKESKSRFINCIDVDRIIETIKQLDEPRKVKVKQFVADWYERNKNNLDYNIWEYIYNWEDQEESEFKNWFNCSKKAFQTLVNMHQFGYEVEEEKRYLVKVKGMLKGFEFLTFKFGHVWIFSNEEEDEEFRLHHTRKELEEAGFGWVFDCPGVEVTEVEG